MGGGTTASALQPQVPGEGAALLQVVLTLCGAAVGRSGAVGCGADLAVLWRSYHRRFLEAFGQAAFLPPGAAK